MDPEQTAGSALFAIEASLTFQQMTFVAIGSLRVKKILSVTGDPL